jgi:hypothetical protein
MSPEEIEATTPGAHVVSVFFGFISGLPDAEFLRYSIQHRDHPRVRQVFFSEIQKRSNLPADIVDEGVELLLAGIEAGGKERAKNETLLRYLQPHLSKQMMTRVFRTILRVGTKTTRNKLLRWLKPEDAPGMEADTLRIAIEGDEDALVGIVYRWPLPLWRQHAESLFKAARDLPWLQRQIIFRSDKIDAFLDSKLIVDPVTELYVRARYRRPASPVLIRAAIERASAPPVDEFDFDDRLGLVAWCLGRLELFEELRLLPDHRALPLPRDGIVPD